MMNETKGKYIILENSVLGRKLDISQKVTILGGGIAGLFMGYYLKKNGFDFEIIEKENRTGGVLKTFQGEFGLIENAAVSFRWGKEITELCEDLNLEILKANDTSYKRYFFINGQFKRFPLTSFETSKTVYKLFFSKTKYPKSLYEFGKNHLGAEATNNFLEPAFQGIYGASSDLLSFPAVLPEIAKNFNNSSSMLKYIYTVLSEKKDPNSLKKPLGFQNGMQDLVSSLHHYLKDHIKLNTTLKQEDFVDDKQIILCVPAYIAATYFKNDLNTLLKEVEYSSILSATIFINKNSLKNLKPGFGCLVPRKEGLNTMGVIYNDHVFQRKRDSRIISSLTLILRDEKKELVNKNKSYLENLLYEEMKTLYGFEGTFLDSKIIKWERGLPLYSDQLYKSWFEINDFLKEHQPNIRLFSNYTGNISIRGMCTAAKEFVED